MKKSLVLFILAIALIGCGGLQGKSINYTDADKDIDITAAVGQDESLDITVNNTTLSIGKDEIKQAE